MTTAEWFEPRCMGNAQGHELALQTDGSVKPVFIVGIAGEELMPRPVEGMDVENRGILPSSFDIAVELLERVIQLTIRSMVSLAERYVIVDRR